MRNGFQSAFDLLNGLDLAYRRLDSRAERHVGGGMDGAHGLLHGARGLYPMLEVRETENGWRLRGDVPGLDPARLTVTVDGQELILEATAEPAREGWTQRLSERRGGAFRRVVRFPSRLDPAGVSAAARDGVVEIEVAKREQEPSVRIEVKAG